MMSESPLESLRITVEQSRLMDKVRDAINTHNSLLTQGVYCPPLVLEDARRKVDIAAQIYTDYLRENDLKSEL